MKFSNYLLKSTGVNGVLTCGAQNQMTMIAKHSYIRSPKLLKNCRILPCQICFCFEETVVAAHSNSSKHGKGRSIKADDNMVAALCYSCHMMIDQGKGLTRQERENSWMMAHLNTVWDLVNNGLWPPEVPLPQTYIDWRNESTN